MTIKILRRAKPQWEGVCGHSVSASTMSNIVKRLDGQLAAFARRRLEETYPYLILDALYGRYVRTALSGPVRC